MNSPRTVEKAFISYAREDEEWARDIKHQLELYGITAFFDQDDLRNGDPWPECLMQGIEACDLFVLVWSRSARSSTWVEKEYCHARALNKRLILQNLDETPVPEELQGFQWGKPLPRSRGKIDDLIQFDFQDPPDGWPPSYLLRAEAGIVPFEGRNTEIEQIERWCNESKWKFDILFLSGPAGIGKTRLMQEIRRRLTKEGWETGFAIPGPLWNDKEYNSIHSQFV